MKTILDIHGMHCASCALTVQKYLAKQDGITKASVSPATERANIEHDATLKPGELIKMVRETGYDASVHGRKEHAKEEDSHADHDHTSHAAHDHGARGVGVAAALGVPLLIIAMGPMMGLPIPHSLAMGIIQLLLAGAILIAGRDVLRSGFFGALKQRRANMDTLIVLGTGAAFLYSTVQILLWAMDGAPRPLFFEAAGLIMAFVLLGRFLEKRAKSRAKGAIQALLELAPETARLVDGGSDKEVPVSEVKKGDELRVKPGDRVPVDGTVTVGASRVDESMLTGEPVPVKKTIGDQVFAGTMNTKGMFLMKATGVGEETSFRRIVRLVEEAQSSQSPVQRVADRISAVFVPVVVALATLAFVFWLFLAPAGVSAVAFAIAIAVSVLIISCPCALGLATPTAMVAAMGRAGRSGLLFHDASALQKLRDARMIAFDKTGTLTKGKPAVVSIRTYGDLAEEIVLRYAASMETASEHPLGDAIVRYAEERRVQFGDPRTFENVEGRGVKGKVEGRKILVGSLSFIKEQGVGIYDLRERIPELAEQGQTPVTVAVEGKLAALLGIADPIREEAKETVAALRKLGLETVMLTGDDARTAKVVAKRLGIDVVRAELRPEDKLSELKKLQKKRSVAMVGDGINDAPALAQADVGIAVGSGTDVALEAADVVVVRDDLFGVVDAVEQARQTMRVVYQNLWWAFGYNALAIPLAAGALYYATGWLLSPAVAAGAMALSSLSVVLNSLRLTRPQRS